MSSKIHGAGLGLRPCHYSHILENKPDVPWFEVLADNYMLAGGPILESLDKIRADYPVTMHSVGMSLGSVDPINQGYVKKLKTLIDRINPEMISDHLCWISVDQQYLNELMPLPYTEEALQHVVNRIKQMQDLLGRRILIENVSSYVQYNHSNMTEWDFLNEVADQADCFILLDINNIHVSAVNHNFSPEIYLNAIKPERVKQFHMAGFTDFGSHLLDSHGAKIHKPVWGLYKSALPHFGPLPTLIEWDNDVPEFDELYDEAKQAQKYLDGYEA